MRVELRLDGTIGLGAAAVALAPAHALLNAIHAAGSVSGAARRLGVSYRTAWARVELVQAAFGRRLVDKTKGHGSSLSLDGLRLHAALGAVLRSFDAPLAEAETSLARILAAAPRLRLAASHDPLLFDALAALADRVETTAAGSLDAVGKLLAGSADLAGFHLGGEEPPPRSPFAQAFADPAIGTVALFRREQGLLLPAGNPAGLRSVADIAATGARFVNRQRGSGTRAWFDRLLAVEGIPPTAIRGYEVEEFTHQAVAAVVAAGAASVGMGVRSAAERFGLDFVPLGQETYYLAARRSAAGQLDQLVAELQCRIAAASRERG